MKFPRCSDCGGNIKLIAKPGRTREIEYKKFCKIPDDYKIPTCTKCGEVYMIPEISEELDEILRQQLS